MSDQRSLATPWRGGRASLPCPVWLSVVKAKMMSSTKQLGFAVLMCAMLLPAYSACRRDAQVEPSPDSADADEQQPKTVLVFPNEFHVDDDSVNAFVSRTMNTCAGGEYDAFRLLWSAREDPLPRDEFEEGWKAVQEIRVRALEPARLAADPDRGFPDPRTVYAVLADVTFDPTHRAARGEPQRRVVLMLIREHDQWRLGRAPKSMRVWMTDKVEPGGVTPTTTNPDHPAGADPG